MTDKEKPEVDVAASSHAGTEHPESEGSREQEMAASSAARLGYRESAAVTVTPQASSSSSGLTAAPLRSAPPPRRTTSTVYVVLAGAAALGSLLYVTNLREQAAPAAVATSDTAAPSEVAARAPAPEPVEPVLAAPASPDTATPSEAEAGQPEAEAGQPEPEAGQPKPAQADAAPSSSSGAKAEPKPAVATSAAKKPKAEPEPTAAEPAAPVVAASTSTTPAAAPSQPEPAAAAPPAAQPSPEPEAKPVDKTDEYSTECLLNPDAPGCREQKTAPGNNSLGDVGGSLPEKLSQTQIRESVTPHAAAAKACREKFGVPAGTLVRIKLSIQGATGKVVGAEALDEHAAQPVGKCVADALSKATFPRFSTSQQGTTYPVRL